MPNETLEQVLQGLGMQNLQDINTLKEIYYNFKQYYGKRRIKQLTDAGLVDFEAEVYFNGFFADLKKSLKRKIDAERLTKADVVNKIHQLFDLDKNYKTLHTAVSAARLKDEHRYDELQIQIGSRYRTALEESLSQLSRDNHSLQTDNQDLQLQVEDISNARNQLEEELRLSRQETSQYRQEAEGLEETANGLAETLASRTKQYNELVSQHEHQLQEALAQNQELAEDYQSLVTENENLIEENQELNTSAIGYLNDIRQLNNEITKLEERCNQNVDVFDTEELPARGQPTAQTQPAANQTESRDNKIWYEMPKKAGKAVYELAGRCAKNIVNKCKTSMYLNKVIKEYLNYLASDSYVQPTTAMHDLPHAPAEMTEAEEARYAHAQLTERLSQPGCHTEELEHFLYVAIPEGNAKSYRDALLKLKNEVHPENKKTYERFVAAHALAAMSKECL